MKKLALAVAVSVSFASGASAQTAGVLSQWVQLTPGGSNEVRVVTEAETCPSLVVDGVTVAMTERAPPNPNFKVHLCAALLTVFVPTEDSGSGKLFDKENPDL